MFSVRPCIQDILSSEAAKQAAINKANGDAQAILARSQATADGLKMLAQQLTSSGGASAAQLRVAEQYVEVGWGSPEFEVCGSTVLGSSVGLRVLSYPLHTCGLTDLQATSYSSNHMCTVNDNLLKVDGRSGWVWLRLIVDSDRDFPLALPA